MFESEAVILTELIRERNLVSPQQLAEIQEEHERTGKPLSQVMVDFGLVTEDQLLRAVAEHLNLEYVNLEDLEVPQQLLRIMPGSVARMYGAVPVSMMGNLITRGRSRSLQSPTGRGIIVRPWQGRSACGRSAQADRGRDRPVLQRGERIAEGCPGGHGVPACLRRRSWRALPRAGAGPLPWRNWPVRLHWCDS